MSLNDSSSEQSRGKEKNLNVNCIHPSATPTQPGDNSTTLIAVPVAQLANPRHVNSSQASVDYYPITTVQQQPVYLTAPNDHQAANSTNASSSLLNLTPDVSTRTFPQYGLDPNRRTFFRGNFPWREGSSSYPHGLVTQPGAPPFNAGYTPPPVSTTSENESMQVTPSMGYPPTATPDRREDEAQMDMLPRFMPTPNREGLSMRQDASHQMPPRAVPDPEVPNAFPTSAVPSLLPPNTGLSGAQHSNAGERRQISRYTGALLPAPGTPRQGKGKGKSRKGVQVQASHLTATASGSGSGHQYDVRPLSSAPTRTPTPASTPRRENIQTEHQLAIQKKSRNREEGGKLALKSSMGKYGSACSHEMHDGTRKVAMNMELKYVAEVEEKKRLKMQQGLVPEPVVRDEEEEERKREMIQKWKDAVEKRWGKIDPPDVGVGMSDPDSLYFAAALIERQLEENRRWWTIWRNWVPEDEHTVAMQDVKEPLERDVSGATGDEDLMLDDDDRMEE